MLRQAHQRIQSGTDEDVLCKEGVNSTFTTFTSDGATPSNASLGKFLNDTSTTAFGPPSTTLTKGVVCITGPFSIGDHLGHQNQTFLLTSGNLACNRSPEDPSKWRGVPQGTPERLVLQADDQRLDHQDPLSRLDPDTMRLISLSQHIERYLNGKRSVYHKFRTVEALGTMLKFLHDKDGLHKHLERIPESVALVRCDIPFYNPRNPKSKEIIEKVVVEHFRSPWTMQWDHRVRVAQVQNPHLWFLSLANGPEKSDETFYDGYISINHETQSLQVTCTPLAAAVTPVAADLPPASGTSMDVDIQQPPVTSVHLSDALSLPTTSFRPPGVPESVSQAQTLLLVTTQKSLDTSDPSLETTDLDTIHGHSGVDSSDDNDNTSNRSLKPFPCPYPDCPKSFTKKGNQKTHTKKHYQNFPCASCHCAFSQETDLDRHYRKVHLGWRWKCNHCSWPFTRESAAGNHTCCHADGRLPAIEKVIVPAEVCRQCQPPEHQQHQPHRKRQRKQCKQQ